MTTKDSKPRILAPLVDEWWQKGDMVAPNKQVEEDIKKAVYTGMWIAMGLLSRAQKMGPNMYKGFIEGLHAECKEQLYTKQVQVVTSICGEPTDPKKN